MPSAPTSPPRPRKERKENADKRRKQLIDATLRSVVANGLSKTTLATVASEAGLSQGVAVFYFKTKDRLLAEALASQYADYEAVWTSHLESAGDAPVDQFCAMILADFAPEICSPEMLAIWFSFWGEARFRPHYSDTSKDFEDRRGREFERICAAMMPGASANDVRERANCIDALTDGFWQKMYLQAGNFTREEALAATFRLLRSLYPEHKARFDAAARG